MSGLLMRIRKKYLILFLLFVLYVCLSILIKPDLLLNYDFLVPWYAALYITKGFPLYEQPEFKLINGEMIPYPYHLPLYIYFLALLIWVFGETLFAGKISLVIFIFCTAILLENILKNNLGDQVEERKIWDYTSVIFLLNPIVILSTVAGLFDSLPILYFLIAFFFLQKIEKEKLGKGLLYSFLAGLSVGVGFLTKIIPIIIFPVIFLALLLRKRFWESLAFSLTAFSLMGGMLWYLFTRYPFIRYLGFGWQVVRGANSFSMYFYLFDMTFLQDLILMGIGMSLLSSFFIYELIKKKNLDLFNFLGIFVTTFFLLYRVYYPHYIIWLLPFLTYIGMQFFEQKKKRNLVILITVFCVQLITNGLWYLDFFAISAFPESLLIALSIINQLCLIVYIIILMYTRIKKKKEVESF